MQRVLGSVNEALGAYDRSRTLLEAAVAGYRELGAEHAPEVSVALRDLGRVVHSAGDAAAAEPYYREALEIADARFGPTSPEAGDIRIQLAAVLITLERLDEAEATLRAGIAARADTGRPLRRRRSRTSTSSRSSSTGATRSTPRSSRWGGPST